MDTERPARAVIGSARVRLSEEAVPVGPTLTAATRGEPKILLVREDGVVRAIDVVCGCGETIRIRCDYGDTTHPGLET